MTKFRVKTLTYEKRTGLSTEVIAEGKVSEEVRLCIKVAVDGTLSPRREQAFKDLVTQSFLKAVADNDLEEIARL